MFSEELEEKMSRLHNYERLRQLQAQIIWPSVLDLYPRNYIPEPIKSQILKHRCEFLISNKHRKLLKEGPLRFIGMQVWTPPICFFCRSFHFALSLCNFLYKPVLSSGKPEINRLQNMGAYCIEFLII